VLITNVYENRGAKALPQKSPGQIFSVQPLMCLGGKKILSKTNHRDTVTGRALRMHARDFVPTVSTAANMLQQAGLISYSRGQMRVLDPDGLREGSCECLELIEKQFAKVFK